MTAAKIDLGRRLFSDPRLSANGSQSCASCHRPERAFTDGRARAVGATGELHPRGAMSLLNVAYGVTLTWADRRVDSLEKQARIPLLNRDPVEMGMAGREQEVLGRLRDDAEILDLFHRAFPRAKRPVKLRNVARALAAYQRTLLAADSAYDRLVFEDDPGALSAEARRGMELFFSDRLKCARCHAPPTFSGPIVYAGAPPQPPIFHNTGLYNLDGKGAYPEGNQGLHEHTGKPGDMGRFRAPTLRNIAVTAPYMHDGSIQALEEVIDHYAAGGRTLSEGPQAGVGRDNPYKSELIAGFELTAGEKRELIAFLKGLTDRRFEGAGEPARSAPSRRSPSRTSRALPGTSRRRAWPGRCFADDRDRPQGFGSADR